MTERRRELGGSAALLALALVAGAATHDVWPWLALALALIAGRHLYYLARLARTLEGNDKVREPLPLGLWRDVYANARRLRSRGRKRKRRLTRFLARFRDAAAAMPDAAVILGPDGRIEWINPASESLLGLSEESDLGALLVDRVPDLGLEAYLATPDAAGSVELRSPVDRSRILSVRATPFGGKREQLVVARDVTRVRLVDAAAEDFVANASHELRTPLTVISGFLEEFATSASDPREVHALELMREQAARMTAIVEDLLAFSRLQMEPVEPARVQVGALLERVVSEARALGATSEHVIELDADPAVEISGEEELLRGAFSNLVFNAVHHTPPRCKVHVRWWGDDSGAHLRVRDTGEGIAYRHIPRLTERFYRVDDSRSRNTGGTGLGLAIVRHALDRHDAELQIESALGAGATFTCHFPPERVLQAAGHAASAASLH